jgi:hypothetical protein
MGSTAGLWGMTLNGSPVRLRVHRCDTSARRLRGMFGSPPPGGPDAWRLRPCAAVHTLFMARAIDVAFCDREGRVLCLFAPLAPWRCALCRGADSAWEFPAGTIRSLGLRVGQRLALYP